MVKKTTEREETLIYAREHSGRGAPAEGAPVSGFSEDWQFREYEKTGSGFKSLSEILDVEVMDGSGSASPSEGAVLADEGRSTIGSRIAGGDDTEIPEGVLAPETDLRIGGEDISGVSEWSMRARRPVFDDGLDAADFARSDEAILQEIVDACDDAGIPTSGIECSVRGGVVFVNGRSENLETRDRFEAIVRELPGVREIRTSGSR